MSLRAWAPGVISCPAPAVAAGGDHGRSLARGDGSVAGPSVVSTIGGDRANRLLRRDLREERRKHRRVAHTTAGDLGRSDLQGLRINAQMDLGPLPRPGGSVLAGAPFPFAHGFDAGAVDQKVRAAPVLGR